MNYPPIEDHGLIGNQETAALVRKDGTIDFMCFPHFDSPTVFGALLDCKNGGLFQIKPEGDFHKQQSYLPDTNILQTTFRGPGAAAIITDFLTIKATHRRRCLVRRIEVTRGEVIFRVVCAPQFGYGQISHKIEQKQRGVLFIPNSKTIPSMLLRASVPLRHAAGKVNSLFCLHGGQSAWLIFEEYFLDLAPANETWITEAFDKTRTYWQNWVARSKYRGRWREMVNRSALTLAMLISRKEGSIVAAPTFGLPERIGGGQNWDYRFTWIRDTSFALDAFLKLGYFHEARVLMSWMEKRCRQSLPDKPLQVVYRLSGDRELPEQQLENLEGYKGSRPVRIGNAASDQLQLDIYGEIIHSVFLFDQYDQPISLEFWGNIRRLVDWVCDNWMRPDDGIWETRDGTRPFFYSRALCWIAVDRALRLARRRSFPAPFVRWQRVRKQIYETVNLFWNKKLKSFVQYEGAKETDASLLLLLRVGFIHPADPRWRSTLNAIKKDLVEDCFVYRYKTARSARKIKQANEGTFSACSFWYARALAERDLLKAQDVFEKFLGYANNLGLYSEQLGPQSEHLGNFPQALSHSSLIHAACDLNERLSKLE